MPPLVGKWRFVSYIQAMSPISLRPARRDEAEPLTALVIRAKASWGYDAAFIDQCRAELMITPDKLDRWTVWVAEQDGRRVGVAAFSTDGDHAELEELMVDPDTQQQGVGTLLLDVVLGECRRRGVDRLELDADPHAEGIYRKLGFSTVGRSPSGSIPGRMLPRMVMALGPPQRLGSL